ncbi:MAG: CvpA family protein [Ruminococcaceae bacterium]|nr:CvpA family protein [Oscillospiraceae bacterium]
MNWIIDLIILAIVLFFVITSAKRGFVKVLIETVGIIAAIVIAFTVSSPISEAVYDKIIEPPIVEAVGEKAEATFEETEESLLDKLPDFIGFGSEKFGISISEFSDKIEENMSAGAETAIKNASQEIIKPVAVKILGLVVSAILMVVLFILVKFLAKLINKMFSFSVVGKINRSLGGVIGLFKGAVFAMLFCVIISAIIAFSKEGFLIFTAENVNNTYLFKFLMGLIPFNIF